MASNEVEFLFKARDEVSKSLQAINAAIEGTGVSAARASRQTSEFTKFVREQRQEQRLQNFLFREGSQAMGALSLGLSLLSSSSTSASRTTRELSNSLNAGFLAFQGISFALSGLNPVIGLTIAGAAGLAAMFGTMNAQSAEAERKVAALKLSVEKLKEELGIITSEQYLQTLNQLLVQSKQRLKEVDGATIDWFATLANRGVPVFRANLEGMLQAEEDVLNVSREAQKKREEIAQKDEELQRKNRAGIDAFMAKLDEEDSAFRKLFDTAFPLQARLNKTIEERIELYQRLGAASLEAITKEASLGDKPGLSKLDKVREIQPQFLAPTLNLQEQIIANFRQMGTVTEQVADTISGTMTNAAEIMAGVMIGSIDRIEDAFRSLIQSMIAELLKIGFLKLFTALIPGVGTGSAVSDTVGTAFGKTVARPAREAATVNIYVAPESRTVTIADRKRVAAVVESWLASEKA